MGPNTESKTAFKDKKFVKLISDNPMRSVAAIFLYFVPWCVLPLTITRFEVSSFFENSMIATVIAAIIILAIGFVIFLKWFLLGSNGNGGGWWSKILLLVFMLAISFVVCVVLLHNSESHKPTDLFNVATLWSAVYGTILGTFCYFKAF